MEVITTADPVTTDSPFKVVLPDNPSQSSDAENPSKSKSNGPVHTISKSLKSASGSRQSRANPRLTRTLKRGASFRPFEEADLKYLWAAYRKGSFRELFRDETTQQEFTALWTYMFERTDGGVWILESGKPVGFIGARDRSHGGHRVLEPHAQWFPWATPRQRLETIVKYVSEMRKTALLTIFSRMSDKDFYTHVCRYGIARRVGTIDGYFGDDPAALFQSKEVAWRTS